MSPFLLVLPLHPVTLLQKTFPAEKTLLSILNTPRPHFFTSYSLCSNGNEAISSAPWSSHYQFPLFLVLILQALSLLTLSHFFMVPFFLGFPHSHQESSYHWKGSFFVICTHKGFALFFLTVVYLFSLGGPIYFRGFKYSEVGKSVTFQNSRSIYPYHT